MNTKSNPTTTGANSRRSGAPTPGHGPQEDQSPAAVPDRSGAALGEHPTGKHPKGEHATGKHPKGEHPTGEHATSVPEDAVARRTATGWKVGDEEVPDLTSAMVLADLLAAELPSEEQWPVPGGVPGIPDTMPDQVVASERGPAADTEQLKETVAQLERALTVRVRVEQAIGVLAERHRLRPRQAFELLRSASRARGARVSQTAGEVVASTTNPLLRIPEELARQPEEPRSRPPRRTRRNP
jgi:hypothetical protein